MAADSDEIDGGSDAKAGKMRLLTLDNIDGRTRAGQFVRDTRSAVLADLGGDDRLSVVERIAVDNVVLVAAMVRDVGARWLIGEPVDPTAVSTLMNTFNRSADKIGWQRRTKDINDLSSYLAQRGAA